MLQQQGGDFAFLGRPANEKALRGVASHFDQDRLRDPVLQALGNHAQPEVVTESNRRPDDRGGILI